MDLNHPGWTSSAPAQPRPAHSIINAFQRANSAAVDTRTSAQRARAELLSKTAEVDKEQEELIMTYFSQLCRIVVCPIA